MSTISNILQVNTKYRLQVVIAALLWVLAFLPGLVLLHFAFDFVDEPYQIMNAQEPLNVPFAPLSSYFGHFFGKIVGWNQLGFRYFAYVLTQLSICIAGFYLYTHRRKLVEATVVTAAAVFANGFYRTNSWHYTWDSCSFLFLTFSTIIFLSYCYRQTRTKLVTLALVSALSICCRMPNIVIIPIIAITIPLCTESKNLKNKLIDSAVYVCITLLATFLILSILYLPMDGFSGWVDAITTNQISNHHPFYLMYSFFNGTGVMIIYLAWLVFCIVALKVLTVHRVRPIISLSILVILSLWVGYADWFDDYFFTLNEFFEAGLLIVLSYSFLCSNSRKSKILFATLAIFSLIPAAGSNTGISKNLALYLVPIIYIFIADTHRKWHRSIAIAILVFGSLYTVRNYVSPFSNNPTEGYSALASSGKFAGIYDRPTTIQTITDISNDVETLRKHGYEIEVLNSTISHFGWEYLLDARNEALTHNWDYTLNFDNYNFKQHVENLINKINSQNSKLKIVVTPEINYTTGAIDIHDKELLQYLDSCLTLESDSQNPWRIYGAKIHQDHINITAI